ncbi:hypothetical protein [Planctomicrobium piriforme]|nr:hypothetical protein [Planctomicrobium piriforme]
MTRPFRLCCCHACIAFALLIAAVPAHGADGAATQQQVSQWVQDLSAPSRKTRELAERELCSLPLADFERLQSDDALGATALTRIRRRIQIREAYEAIGGAEFRAQKEIKIEGLGHVATGGCLAISGVATNHQSDDEDSPNLIRVRLRLDVAPDVRPIDVLLADADLELNCGGERLQPFSPNARREIACDGQQVELTVNFLAPHEVKATSCQLSGRLLLRCSAGDALLTFPLNAVGAEPHRVGQTEVELAQVQSDNDGLSATLRVATSPGITWESYRAEVLHRGVWLQTKNGERIPCPDIEVSAVEGDLHTVRCRFSGIKSEDAALICQAPAVVANVPVQFSLGEIPLEPLKASNR